VFSIDFSPDEINIIDFYSLEQYCPLYFKNQSEYFKSNTKMLNERLCSGFFERALNTLNKKIPELYSLVRFFIKVVVVNQLEKYTNGTNENTIGLSIMDFKDEFNEMDFVELLVHQLTHMLYFMSNHIDKHISYKNMNIMIPTKYQFILGGNSFPAYLAFHSYLVAIEILMFRYRIGSLDIEQAYHGSTNRIIDIANELATQISKHIYLFTPAGKSIFKDSINCLESLRSII
ncbi:MAG: hypothetical protein KC414_01430, partial [Romboutsia sp.]|nr:hypothetical protein [Romboutsia sp.]